MEDSLASAAKNTFPYHDVRGELMDIAMKAMTTAPEDRYPAVKEFQSAVRAYQEHRESIVIAEQAAEDLLEGLAERNYHKLARATYAYEESVTLWPDNASACEGAMQARFSYAQMALEEQDYSLAQHILDEGVVNTQAICRTAKKVSEETPISFSSSLHPLRKRLRSALARERRQVYLQRGLIVGVIVLLIGVLVVSMLGLQHGSVRNVILPSKPSNRLSSRGLRPSAKVSKHVRLN